MRGAQSRGDFQLSTGEYLLARGRIHLHQTRREANIVHPVEPTTYRSKFTGNTEQLPAAVGIIGAKGSDVMLAELVNAVFESHQLGAANKLDQKPLAM